jgi:Family of unknown function (DUF6502)
VEGRARAQALTACGQVLVPLARMLIDLGISAAEFSDACKQIFVHAAADRLAGSTRRLNRSRIAIVTGLTRAEVTKILGLPPSGKRTLQSHLHRARRVITGWRTDSEFASRQGRPRTLPVKGRRGSFEALVKRYSGDIPTRAMFDELLAMSVVIRQKNGRVRLGMGKTAATNARKFVLLGQQGRALLETLCHNLQNPNKARFVGTVTGRKIDQQVLDLLSQRIHTQGREFLSRIEDQFKHPPRAHKTRGDAEPSTLGVTVFTYRETGTGRGRRS